MSKKEETKQPSLPEIALVLINRADIKASEAQAVVKVQEWLAGQIEDETSS